MIAIVLYLAAVTALAAYLDERAGAENFNCENSKPSTSVCAWSWLAFPFVAIWGILG